MVIVGTGGHATDLLSDGSIISTYRPLYFFNSVNNIVTPIILERFKVFKTVEDLIELPNHQKKFILALGTPKHRMALYQLMENAGLEPISYISPFALVAFSAVIGNAVNIMPFAAIFGESSLGMGTLVNSHSTVHHEVSIGDFCEISPGSRILGKAVLEEHVQIGANTTVLPGIKIGHHSIVGAGSVVNRNLPSNCLAAGVPAKIIRHIDG